MFFCRAYGRLDEGVLTGGLIKLHPAACRACQQEMRSMPVTRRKAGRKARIARDYADSRDMEKKLCVEEQGEADLGLYE